MISHIPCLPGAMTEVQACCHMCIQVMTQRHSMLRRQALLLRAGMEPLTDADRARLEVAPCTCMLQLGVALGNDIEFTDKNSLLFPTSRCPCKH